jgi:Na+/H+-dicarboxylate symporter
MKRLLSLVTITIAIVLFTGCSQSIHPIPTYDISKVDFSKSKQWKEGESCKGAILMIIPTGLSNSVKDAAEDGNISTVLYTEQDIFDVFLLNILYHHSCITVYGN